MAEQGTLARILIGAIPLPLLFSVVHRVLDIQDSVAPVSLAHPLLVSIADEERTFRRLICSAALALRSFVTKDSRRLEQP